MRAASFSAGLALATVAFVALLGGESHPFQGPGTRMSKEQSQAIKREMVAVECAGKRDCGMADFELDHRWPLCMGGSNDRSNLQLQRWHEARLKDADEVAMCQARGAEQKRLIAAFCARWGC